MAKPVLDNNALLKIQAQVEAIPPFALSTELKKVAQESLRQPKNTAVQFAAGLMMSRAGNQQKAVQHLLKSLKLSKNNEVVLGALAYVYAARLKDFASALKYLQKKLQANQRDPATLLMMANCHMEIGDTEKALNTLDKAAPLVKDKIRIHGMKSRCFLRMGDSKAARSELLAVAALDPTGIVAVGDMLASLPDNSPDQINELRDILSDALENNLSKFRDETHQSMSAAALGNVYESQGDFDQAFAYFQRANKTQPADKQAIPFTQSGEFLIQRSVFTAEFFNNAPKGHSSTEQIFVVGMPRSGTTLLESILGAHPQIVDFGELEFFARQLHALGITSPEDITVEQRTERVRSNLFQAPEDGFRNIATQYIQSSGFEKFKGKFKVDKMPLNFRALGLIAAVFPNAKVIHARRHPMDTCLSVFKNPLRGYNTTFANDLEVLGDFFIEYDKLMRYWHDVLPIEIHEVRYEEMVSNTEVHAREMLHYVGLEWDEACLTQRKAKRDVNTASLWQVRQDIYTSSVQKWRTFEAPLAPLAEKLSDAIREYEAQL
ncbi:MAG: sulfotransferase [Pseudomonadota bacterium]